jgi:two-component system, LytTR family, sensor histidine kinase AlgZ
VHPILANRGRLLLYLALWLAFGALFAAEWSFERAVSFDWAFAFTAPLAMLMSLQSLSSWYLVRILPAATTRIVRLAGIWAGAALVSLVVWMLAARGWAELMQTWAGPRAVLPDSIGQLLFTGCIGFAVGVSGHYVMAVMERAREIERQALQLRITARDAEMHFLRRQIDPHFLFNSLNSVTALIGTDALAARRMCQLLADFFRMSIRHGSETDITLEQEFAMAETFLAIEQVRYGDRLKSRLQLSEDARALAVPALLLQPLIENAVHHGIAHLLEGGQISVVAQRRNDRLEITVTNPCAGDRPPSRGSGVGLKNVRGRLEARYANRAGFDVSALPENFSVRIVLPAETLPIPADRDTRVCAY